ncbi:hypothetical protein TNCV_2097191 [Trichonephila clavipes]|nr:hypothetical protein TNCV_2097191 [Trichonephila clavipes]
MQVLLPYNIITHSLWAESTLVVRASDSRVEGLSSMPDAPKCPPVHVEYVLGKLVGLKVLWVVVAGTTGAEGRIIFPSTPCLNCGGGDRWCRHLSVSRKKKLCLQENLDLLQNRTSESSDDSSDEKTSQQIIY